MVRAAITHRPATPEPDVRVSPSGSSVERSLSLTPFRVGDIVTVGVQQDEVSRVIVGVVAVPMMHFQHVLCREA